MATRPNPDHDEVYVVPRYEDDLAAWAHHQAMLLRAGQLHLLDRAWIAEELDDVGSAQHDKLESALRLVLMHMLKWDHQRERRSRSWTVTIATNRRRIAQLLARNPSLKSRLPEALLDAYADARSEASGETDLPLKTFPPACPYDWSAVMDRAIALPDEA